MFPTIMPRLMALALKIEAIRGKNCEKNLNNEKNTAIIWVVMQDARIVLHSNRGKILCK
jgi:hypothetical protein